LKDQRLASGDILSAVDVEERDFFVTKSSVGRVVFQFLLELVAEDEMALALVQIGGNEVFGTELEEDIIEFGRRGFGECREGSWTGCQGEENDGEEGSMCIPVFL
jgi:hypothetical protein